LRAALHTSFQPVTRRTDFIEWNSTDLGRQADGAPDLVFDPGHAALIGAHVRPGNVFDELADGARERG